MLVFSLLAINPQFGTSSVHQWPPPGSYVLRFFFCSLQMCEGSKDLSQVYYHHVKCQLNQWTGLQPAIVCFSLYSDRVKKSTMKVLDI